MPTPPLDPSLRFRTAPARLSPDGQSATGLPPPAGGPGAAPPSLPAPEPAPVSPFAPSATVSIRIPGRGFLQVPADKAPDIERRLFGVTEDQQRARGAAALDAVADRAQRADEAARRAREFREGTPVWRNVRAGFEDAAMGAAGMVSPWARRERQMDAEAQRQGGQGFFGRQLKSAVSIGSEMLLFKSLAPKALQSAWAFPWLFGAKSGVETYNAARQDWNGGEGVSRGKALLGGALSTLATGLAANASTALGAGGWQDALFGRGGEVSRAGFLPVLQKALGAAASNVPQGVVIAAADLGVNIALDPEANASADQIGSAMLDAVAGAALQGAIASAQRNLLQRDSTGRTPYQWAKELRPLSDALAESQGISKVRAFEAMKGAARASGVPVDPADPTTGARYLAALANALAPELAVRNPQVADSLYRSNPALFDELLSGGKPTRSAFRRAGLDGLDGQTRAAFLDALRQARLRTTPEAAPSGAPGPDSPAPSGAAPASPAPPAGGPGAEPPALPGQPPRQIPFVSPLHPDERAAMVPERGTALPAPGGDPGPFRSVQPGGENGRFIGTAGGIVPENRMLPPRPGGPRPRLVSPEELAARKIGRRGVTKAPPPPAAPAAPSPDGQSAVGQPPPGPVDPRVHGELPEDLTPEQARALRDRAVDEWHKGIEDPPEEVARQIRAEAATDAVPERPAQNGVSPAQNGAPEKPVAPTVPTGGTDKPAPQSPKSFAPKTPDPRVSGLVSAELARRGLKDAGANRERVFFDLARAGANRPVASLAPDEAALVLQAVGERPDAMRIHRPQEVFRAQEDAAQAERKASETAQEIAKLNSLAATVNPGHEKAAERARVLSERLSAERAAAERLAAKAGKAEADWRAALEARAATDTPPPPPEPQSPKSPAPETPAPEPEPENSGLPAGSRAIVATRRPSAPKRLSAVTTSMRIPPPVHGAKVRESIPAVMRSAIENMARQPNYVHDEAGDRHCLLIDGRKWQVAKSAIRHASDRRFRENSVAAASIGDLLNASAEMPGDGLSGGWRYRIARLDAPDGSRFVLMGFRDEGDRSTMETISVMRSLNTKADGAAAQGFIPTDGAVESGKSRNGVTVAELRDAFKTLFLPGLKQHLAPDNPAAQKLLALGAPVTPATLREAEQMEFHWGPAGPTPAAVLQGAAPSAPRIGRKGATRKPAPPPEPLFHGLTRERRVAAFRAVSDRRWAASHPDALRDALALLDEGVPVDALLRERFTGQRVDWPVRGMRVTGPEDVAALCSLVRNPFQETMKAVYLDEKGDVLDARVVSLGFLDSCCGHPRNIFGHPPPGAATLVLAHNHPSGNPTPSDADLRLTRTMVEAGELLGLPVADHVITDTGRFFSFRQGGTMDMPGSYAGPDAARPGAARQIGKWDAPADWEPPGYADGRPGASSPEDALALARHVTSHDPGSSYVLHLDRQNRLLGVSKVGVRAPLDPRELARALAAHPEGAAAILLLGGNSRALPAAALGVCPAFHVPLLDAIDLETGDSWRRNEWADFKYGELSTAGFRHAKSLAAASEETSLTASKGSTMLPIRAPEPSGDGLPGPLQVEEPSAPYDAGARPDSRAPSRVSPISPGQITDLARSLWPDIPIVARGSARSPRAGGEWQRRDSAIRLARMGDLEALSRSLGEMVWDTAGLSRRLPGSALAELDRLAATLGGGPGAEPPSVVRRALFGGFLHDWLCGEASAYSTALRHPFDAWLDANPQEAFRLFAMHDAYGRYRMQDPDQAIAAAIGQTRAGSPVSPRTLPLWLQYRTRQARDRARKHGRRIELNWVDRNLFLRHITDDAGLRDLIDPRAPGLSDTERAWRFRHDPYLLASYFEGRAHSYAEHCFLNRVPTSLIGGEPPADGGDGGRPGVGVILSALHGKGADGRDLSVSDFLRYAVAKRGLGRYFPEGRALPFTEEEARAVAARHECPEYARALDQLTGYAHHLLGFLEESGAISSAERKAIEDANPVYIPLLRVFSEDAGGSGSPRPMSGSGLHRLSANGSLRDIQDPLVSLATQTQRIVANAQRHAVLKALVELYDRHGGAEGVRIGKLMREVEVPRGWREIKASEIAKAAWRAASETDATGDRRSADKMREAVDNWADQFWGSLLTVPVSDPASQKPGQRVARVVIDGRPRWFEIDSPELWERISPDGRKGTAAEDAREFTEGAVDTLMNCIRMGATSLNPRFALGTNPVRDTLTALMMGQYAPPGELFMNARAALRAVHESGADLYADTGMGTTLGTYASRSGAKSLARAAAARGRLARAWHLGILRSASEALSFMESGPRKREYYAAYDDTLRLAGGDHDASALVAGCAARDVTTFFQRGGNASRRLSRFIAVFFNAFVQGLEKFPRSIGLRRAAPWEKYQRPGERAAHTLGRMALFGTGTAFALAAIRALFSTDEQKKRYREMADHDKTSYLLVPSPNGIDHARIPVPFLPGVFSMVIPTAAIDYADGDKRALSRCLDAVLEAGPAQFDLGTDSRSAGASLLRFASVLAPIVDIIANRNWYGAPIVGHRYDKTPIRQRADEKTTLLARKVADVWSAIPLFYDVSPIGTQYLLDTASGGAVGTVAEIADDIRHPTRMGAGGDLSTVPVLGSLFVPRDRNGDAQRFYERRDKLRDRDNGGNCTIEELGELGCIADTAGRLDKLFQDRFDARQAEAKGELGPREFAAEIHRLDAETRAILREHAAKVESTDLRAKGLASAMVTLTANATSDARCELLMKSLASGGVSYKQAETALLECLNKQGAKAERRRKALAALKAAYGIR